MTLPKLYSFTPKGWKLIGSIMKVDATYEPWPDDLDLKSLPDRAKEIADVLRPIAKLELVMSEVLVPLEVGSSHTLRMEWPGGEIAHFAARLPEVGPSIIEIKIISAIEWQ